MNKLLSFFKNALKNGIKDLMGLQNKKHFEYFSYLGIFYLIKLVAENIYKFKGSLYRFIFKRNLKMIYGSGWVIFSNGGQEYIVDICYNLLKYNKEYKIMLVGDNESLLINNVEKIKILFDHLEGDKIKIEFLFLNFAKNEEKLFTKYEQELNSKLVERNISLVFLNSEYFKLGLFNNLSTSEIKEIFNTNILSNDFLLLFTINSKSLGNTTSNKTLIINFGNLVTNLKLPYLQFYSSCKLAFKKKLMDLYNENNKKIDILYLEDYNKDLDEININFSSVFNSTNNGFAFLSIKNKLWLLFIKSNLCSKRIILDKLKSKYLIANKI